MYHFQKMSHFTCPEDMTRHTSRFVSAVYTALFCYLHSFRVAMESRRRPLVPMQPTVLAPELGPCTYVEVICPAFDPNRVLLRRVFFLNDSKPKYVSVGFYPAHKYQSHVEFGGVKLLPMLHTSDYVPTMAERLPSLVEAMCQNEQYQCRSEDKVFRMNTTGSQGLPE